MRIRTGGKSMPRFYAPAYYVDYENICVCYLFPFNLIIRWAREAYYTINSVNPVFKRNHPMYLKGYEAGRRNDPMYYLKAFRDGRFDKEWEKDE